MNANRYNDLLWRKGKGLEPFSQDPLGVAGLHSIQLYLLKVSVLAQQPWP